MEARALAAFALAASVVEFPFGRQCRRGPQHHGLTADGEKTARTVTETRFYVSSAEATDYTPAQWQALVCGHWGGARSAPLASRRGLG